VAVHAASKALYLEDVYRASNSRVRSAVEGPDLEYVYRASNSRLSSAVEGLVFTGGGLNCILWVELHI
jgi:hypothetical protein